MGSVWVVTVAEMQIDEDSVFADWYQAVEPRVGAALVAHLGPDAGPDAAAAALRWAWEHWERMATVQTHVERGMTALRERLGVDQ